MRPATSEDVAPPPVIWTLAGSDSGSGAGCQADLLTGHDFGVHVCTLITAITAQNSQGVTAVMPVPVEVLQAQWATLINDMPPSVIKIGMLADGAQVQALARWLAVLKQERPDVRVVLDPVGIASSGDALCAHGTRSALAMLWPFVDLLTPNSGELAELAGLPIDSPAAQIAACQQLCTAGIGAVLAKGGHLAWLAGYSADLWYTPAAGYWLVLPRLATPHSHGTGCTLASAVACLLALGYVMVDAVTLARAYVQQGLHAARAVGLGAGPVAHTGWPHRADCLPHILPANCVADSCVADSCVTDNCVVDSGTKDSVDDGLSASWQRLLARPAFAPCPPALGFYPVVDSLAWVEKLLAWGVQTLQLRIKRPVDATVEAEVAMAIALARQAGARLFINDHWALALKLGAWGVHLGQEDLVTADLAALAGAGIRLGISTHGPFELALAMGWHPSCIALGHIFPTQTKQMPSRPQGIAGLHRQIPLCGSMPTIAIGGIDLARVGAVRATGVGAIAVVSAITAAPAPQQAVGAFFAAMARVTPATRHASVEVFHAA